LFGYSFPTQASASFANRSAAFVSNVDVSPAENARLGAKNNTAKRIGFFMER